MSAASAELYDVLVIGGGPAGSAAGIAAARRGLRVLILERGSTPLPGPCAGWFGPASRQLCVELGVPVDTLGGQACATFALRSWNLEQHVPVRDPELRGWLTPPARLASALLAAAQAAGAEVRTSHAVTRLTLAETDSTAELADGRTVTGRVLIVADGQDSGVAGQAQLQPAHRVGGELQRVGVRLACREQTPSIDILLGPGRRVQVGVLVRGPDGGHLELLVRNGDDPGRAIQPILEGLRGHGVEPDPQHATPVSGPALAGTALEMDSHVGKRALLVGAAGGFVAAFSGEALYPALRSGVLAGEAAAAALAAPVLQDALAAFSADWRTDLAEYLRMPNTDLGLLMPMVFGNAQMSRRVARAYVLGQPF